MNPALEDRLYEAGVRRLNGLDGLDGSAPGSATDARRRSLEHFRRLGLPSKRDEAWRYLPLRRLFSDASRLAEVAPGIATPERLRARLRDLPLSPQIVLVGGRRAPELEEARLPAGTELLSGAALEADAWTRSRRELRAGAEPDAVAALSAALAPEGLLVRVSGQAPSPIVIVHLLTTAGDGPLSFGETWLHLTAGARADAVQLFVSLDDSTTTYLHQSVVTLEEGAELSEARLSCVSPGASLVLRADVAVGPRANYQGNQQLLRGGVLRSELSVELGEEARASLSGLALADGDRHAEHELRVHHAGPRAQSEQVYKTIANDRARTAFSGRVIVDEAAKGAVAHQSNKNLLLSREAEVNTRPQLEIYAKEVEASHGATVGQLEEDQVFYLASRGVDETTARAMLRAAFVVESFGAITVEPARRWARGEALAALGVPAELVGAEEESHGDG